MKIRRMRSSENEEEEEEEEEKEEGGKEVKMREQRLSYIHNIHRT